jgi:hypothetical protein
MARTKPESPLSMQSEIAALDEKRLLPLCIALLGGPNDALSQKTAREILAGDVGGESVA